LFNPSGNLTNPWHLKLVGEHGGSDPHAFQAADLDNNYGLDIVLRLIKARQIISCGLRILKEILAKANG